MEHRNAQTNPQARSSKTEKVILHLDFETRSACDLRKAGLDVYAADPSTQIICAAYAFGEGPVKLWCPLRPGEPDPLDLSNALRDMGVELHSYNAPFEMAIINNILRTLFTAERARCVMAMSYAMGLPGSLENCAKALGVDQQKDTIGSRLIQQYCRPRIAPEDNGGAVVWWEDPEKLERIYQYCVQDVETERAVEKRMLALSPYEQKVWELDYRINRRGVKVDVPSVRAAINLVENEKDRLNREMRHITNNAVATCTAVQQIKDYFELFGMGVESVDKASVGALLSTTLPPVLRRVCELRREAGKAATAKFTPMAESAGADWRVRGCYQYSGANTRRWAGRRIQLHNLQRQKSPYALIRGMIADVRAGLSAEELALYYGPPMDILGECTRSFLMADEGKEFHCADFSAIEARVLAWLAGEESVLAVFRNGQDIYKSAAAGIFGVKTESVTDEQRQVGKVAVLALGYGGGVGAFQTMAKGYGVKMEPAYQYLMGIATPEHRIRSEATWNSSKKKEEITKKEFIASELTKIFWREANPAIVNFWYQLENAAVNAVQNPGKLHKAGKVGYKKAGSFLVCFLPGGGKLIYPYPKVEEIETPWGEKKNGLTYMAEDGQSKSWVRFKTYGGSLAENVTQAVSRDLQADAMLRLDAAGFSIVIHTHDEIGCEEFEGKRTLREMIAIMTQIPPWAQGLPLKAAGFTGDRYRK